MINITKIAKNNIKYNKSKSILIILTIFLATTLLSSVAMVGLDWTEVNKKKCNTVLWKLSWIVWKS